jgi:hypothetical protein
MNNLLIGVGIEICKYNYKPPVQAYEEWIAKEKAEDGLSFKPS